jgi:hypothetical protein
MITWFFQYLRASAEKVLHRSVREQMALSLCASATETCSLTWTTRLLIPQFFKSGRRSVNNLHGSTNLCQYFWRKKGFIGSSPSLALEGMKGVELPTSNFDMIVV